MRTMKRFLCVLCVLLISGLALATSVGALTLQDLEEIQRAIHEKGARWEAGDNPIFRLSTEDQKRLCGAIPDSPEPIQDHLRVIQSPKANLPERLDWRNKDGINWLTPIRNQAGCGSCVAFGTIAAFEGLINIFCGSPGQDLDLSEQHIFSCGGGSCYNGWWPAEATQFLQDYGAPLESCLPYEARDDNCHETCDGWQEQARKISEWGTISLGAPQVTVEQIKNRMMDGPVTGVFWVYEDFSAYSSGVYQYVWGDLLAGHCIAIVGWDDADSCWICKNSWGPSWGENGYFRIRMGHNEVAIEKYVHWMIPQPAHSAYVEMAEYHIAEQAGNGDQQPNPGEIFDLTVTLENKRTYSDLTDVMGWLLPEDSRVSVMNGVASYSTDLPAGGTSTNDDDPFRLQMSENIGITSIPFTFYVTGTAGGTYPYSTQLSFQLPVTYHQAGWPVELSSGVRCSPLMVWAGGSWHLAAADDAGYVHLWDDGGEEVAGFPFHAPGGNIWGSVALGDVDGYGAEEIVFGSKNDTVYALCVDGSVAFKRGVGSDVYATPALSDLNGDGELEIIFGTTDSRLHVLTSQGKDYFPFPVLLGGSVVADAAVADLDGDGSLDVVVGADDGLLYAISTQTGEYLSGFPVVTEGAIWSSPVVADLDRNGYKEVIVGSDDRKLYAFNFRGEVLFTRQASQAIRCSPAVADLSAANGLEVVFTSLDGQVYVVNRQGNLVAGWPYDTGGVLLSSPVVLDIDGDGALEVVVEGPGPELLHLEADGSLSLALSMEPNGPAISSPVAGYLDGDGDLEVAIGAARGVSVWSYPTGGDVAMPWPMYRGNAQRTGYLEDNVTGRVEGPVAGELPVSYALWQNYPNPFNPRTSIGYCVAREGQVRLSVYNVLGQEVVVLAEGPQASGRHVVTWDGRDAGGRAVASGLYFCRLEAGDFVQTQKMLLLR
jgi:C1A family cysteine protease